MEYPGTALQEGSEGAAVKAIQKALGIQQTGRFGPTTKEIVIAFQSTHGLGTRGIVGPHTWNAIMNIQQSDEMTYPGIELKEGSTGEHVLTVQKRLGVQQTGVFGPTTEACVTTFQNSVGLDADGVVGPNTWKALFAKPAPNKDIGAVALRVARQNLGQSEKPLGSNRGPMVDQYLASIGLGPGHFWCMAFVYYCIEQASNEMGLGSIPVMKTGSCSALYSWAKKKNQLVARPEVGDIFLCIGGEKTHFHTGFVAGPVKNERFETIEGNSNDDGSSNGTEVAYRNPGRRVATCHYVRL